MDSNGKQGSFNSYNQSGLSCILLQTLKAQKRNCVMDFRSEDVKVKNL